MGGDLGHSKAPSTAQFEVRHDSSPCKIVEPARGHTELLAGFLGPQKGFDPAAGRCRTVCQVSGGTHDNCLCDEPGASHGKTCESSATSENAVKARQWMAIPVYVLAAIKKALQIGSPYSTLNRILLR
jgi:hypothetical protein